MSVVRHPDHEDNCTQVLSNKLEHATINPVTVAQLSADADMSLAEHTYSTAEGHVRLEHELTDGSVEISISRTIARQFYTMTPLAEIKSKTGRSQVLAKGLVWIGLLLAPLLFILSALLIIYYYGWWAAINIPMAGILWSIIAGFLNPTGSWATMTGALAFFTAVALTNLVTASLTLPLLLWTASLWVNRMTYQSAAFFLTRLIITSRAAFEQLEEHITVKNITADPP